MERTHHTGIPTPVPLTGVAAGVPYTALPPTRGRRGAPLVVAWPGLNPPRTQRAMAAALPLARLRAWRVYLDLPGVGTRAPAAGPQHPPRLDADDFVLKLVGPMVEQAFAEFPAVVAALRVQLKPSNGPVGLLGEETGATVALLMLAEGELPVQAAALLRPAVQLERLVAANQRGHNPHHQWTGAARAVAARLDFVARARRIAGRNPQPAVLLQTGIHDDASVREPVQELWHTLAHHYRDPGRVGLLIAPETAYALPEEPDPDPTSPTPDAAWVDAAVTGWLDRHLPNKEAS
jgi:hypothetical protein